MSCKICGRGSCADSFHTIKYQDAFAKYEGLDEKYLIRQLVDRDYQIADHEAEVSKIERRIWSELHSERGRWRKDNESLSDGIKELEKKLSYAVEALETWEALELSKTTNPMHYSNAFETNKSTLAKIRGDGGEKV